MTSTETNPRGKPDSDEWRRRIRDWLEQREEDLGRERICGRDPRRPRLPRPYLTLLPLSGIDSASEIISMSVVAWNRGNLQAWSCFVEAYEAPQFGPLPPVSELQRRGQWVFSLAPGEQRTVSLPPARVGPKRLVCICQDPILDPLPFPTGVSQPNDRRIAVFGSVSLD